MTAVGRLLAGGVASLLTLGVLAPAASQAASGTPVGGPALGTTGLAVDAPGAEPLPEVAASAYLLADLGTGEVLAAKDPHGRWRPASTLKMLTALTLLPRLDPTTVYTAQWEDANVEGSRAGIVPDATYTVDQLFQALFLVSGNDAANALANAAGGVPQTVAAMSRTARDLGALDTTVRNPSGLDAPAQVTSAYDLAVIARAALAREDFRALAATVKVQFPGKMPRAGKVRKTFEIYTQDRLLLNYRGAIGVKTGWTTKARGTFVGAATRKGRTLVATVLHSNQDSWRDSAALLSWGFRNAALANPVGTLDAVGKPAAGTEVTEPRSGTDAVAAASPAATAGSPAGLGLPWWLDVVLLLALVVGLLRSRVLLRRRLRQRRPAAGPAGSGGSAGPARSGVGLPQSRDRRRVRTPASPAPAAAPSSTPRTVTVLRDEPPPAARSGTAS